MPTQTPSVTLTSPPGTGFTFRSQGKTISVAQQGRATIVTLTFDSVGASDDVKPDGTAAIAMPGEHLWVFQRRAPATGALSPSPPAQVATKVLTDLLR